VRGSFENCCAIEEIIWTDPANGPPMQGPSGVPRCWRRDVPMEMARPEGEANVLNALNYLRLNVAVSEI